MTDDGRPRRLLTGDRIMIIGWLVAAIAVGLIFAVHPRRHYASVPPHPEARSAVSPVTPIAFEADVFRGLAMPASTPPSGGALTERAHLGTTLEIYRALRAYPGAPPRIPHGLTADEYRTSECLACHASGGFVSRFGSYAPVTPHPEYTECLQCHVADQRLLGRRPARSGSAETCGQCHVNPGTPAPLFVAIDWRPAAWPRLIVPTHDGAPPLIPHGFHMRSNCVACHGGPGALESIRTSHPERANCRQCHLSAAPENGEFVRPPSVTLEGVGGDR